MNVQEALAWIDKQMTEVDLELWQWQTDIDALVFAGLEVSLVLYDGNVGEVKARLHHDDSALRMTGATSVRIPLREDRPVLREPEDWWGALTRKLAQQPSSRLDLPIVRYEGGRREEIGYGTACAHFEIDEDGTVRQNVLFEGTLTEAAAELIKNQVNTGIERYYSLSPHASLERFEVRNNQIIDKEN